MDSTAISLTWSVHHDPETTEANKVTIGGGQLIVNAGSRTSTRRVILRATTGMGDSATIVNDYHVRILFLDDGLQDPWPPLYLPGRHPDDRHQPQLRCYQ